MAGGENNLESEDGEGSAGGCCMGDDSRGGHVGSNRGLSWARTLAISMLLSTLQAVILSDLCRRNYYTPLSTDEETEAQRG